MEYHYHPLQQIKDLLMQASNTTLSVKTQQAPYVEPIKVHMMTQDHLLFGIGELSYAFQLLIENRYCTIFAYHDNGAYLCYSGTIVLNEDPKAAQLCLQHFPELKKYYNQLTGLSYHTFYLQNARAVFYDHDHRKHVIFEEDIQ